MWAYYDYTNFPIVKVKCKGPLRSNKDYKDFVNNWIQLYDNKKKFKFIFDTKECGYVHIKYAYSMVSFIKKLKQLPVQYLESSIITYNNIGYINIAFTLKFY